MCWLLLMTFLSSLWIETASVKRWFNQALFPLCLWIQTIIVVRKEEIISTEFWKVCHVCGESWGCRGDRMAFVATAALWMSLLVHLHWERNARECILHTRKKYQTENSNLKVLKEKRITAYVASQCWWPIFFYHLKRGNLVLYYNVQLNLRGVWVEINLALLVDR